MDVKHFVFWDRATAPPTPDDLSLFGIGDGTTFVDGVGVYAAATLVDGNVVIQQISSSSGGANAPIR